MKNIMNTMATTSVALMLGLACAGTVIAQQSQLDPPRPDTNRTSCAQVDWNRDLLRDYPWVANGCQEVVIIDGQKWARFEAEFQEMNRDGTFTSNFRNDRGRSLGTVSLQPGPGQRVDLDGRMTPFSDLRRGQVLNFYAPEGTYAFTTEPGSTEQVQIVQNQNRDTQLAREQNEQRSRDEAARRSRQLAQAEPARETRPSTLPATAGPLPIIALGGLLSLLGGIGLTMRRGFKESKV